MRRLLKGSAVAASALILLLSLTGWAASEHYLSALRHVDVFGGLGSSGISNGEPVNILVVGSDDRSGLSEAERSRLRTGHLDYGRHTDTMLLVHLGTDLDNVSVVSIPRDSLVTIPAHTDDQGQNVAKHEGKINSAFATGGPAVTVATVAQATGLEIDHYVEVNFKGFLDMVNAVNGVPVCLSEPLQDLNSGLDLPAGRQTIRGKQALAYVRARYIDNDFGRAKRQQRFLTGMAQKVTAKGTLLNPITMNNFVDAALNSVTTDERMDRESVAMLAARLADLSLEQIQFTTVPVSDGSHMHEGESTVLWDSDAATQLFDALREDQAIPEAPKAVTVEVPPGDIDVAVEGSQSAASAVEAAGYQVLSSTGTVAAETVVRYDPVWQRSLATMQAAFPQARFEEAPGIGGTFQVALGADFQAPKAVRSAATSVESEVTKANKDLCADGAAGS
ncbi:MAG: LCP family protein [Actinobacteria bacterium]|nr:LCP family protein [Actinomycetota bacterium]